MRDNGTTGRHENGGPALNNFESTEATVVWIWKSFIVALCGKGFLYYQPWKGKEPGWVNLREGDLVRVYHTGGYNPQLHTLEALLDPVAAHDEAV